MRDLIVRADQIREWAMTAMPKVFWLPGMTYPTGKAPSTVNLASLAGTDERYSGVCLLL